MVIAVKNPPKKKAAPPFPPSGEASVIADEASVDFTRILVKLIELDDKNARDAISTARDRASFQELVASVKSQGVLQPICLFETGHGRYGIVFGHRRLLAAIEAGRREIPAIVLDHEPDAQELQSRRWDENAQRLDLNPVEKAVAVEHRVDALGGDVAAAAAAMGWTERQVRDQLYLRRLTDKVRKLVVDGKINAGQARELVKLEGKNQERMATELVAEQASGPSMSIEDLREWIEDAQRPLAKVQWKLEIPFAGKPACVSCQFNTDSNVDLFGTPAGEARCTNAACYEAKERAVGAANTKIPEKVKEMVERKAIAAEDAASIEVARDVAPAYMKPEVVQKVIKAALPAKPAAAAKGIKKEAEKKGTQPTEFQKRQQSLMKWGNAISAWKRDIAGAIKAAAAADPCLGILAIILDIAEPFTKLVNFISPASDYELQNGDYKGRTSPIPEKPLSPVIAGLLNPQRARTLDGLVEIAKTIPAHEFRPDIWSIGPEATVRVAAAFGLPASPPPVFEDFLPEDLRPAKKPAAAAAPSKGAREMKTHEQLEHALHSFAEAAHRWDQRRESGRTDAELKADIGEEFGIQGSSSGPGDPGENHRGGKDPAFWLGSQWCPKAKPTLTGAALVSVVRELMNIPKPAAALGSGLCQKCGCDQEHACEDGCSWANRGKTLCTRCVPITIIEHQQTEGRFDLSEITREVLDLAYSAQTIARGSVKDPIFLPPGFPAYTVVMIKNGTYTLQRLIPADRWTGGDPIDLTKGEKALDPKAAKSMALSGYAGVLVTTEYGARFVIADEAIQIKPLQ